MAVLGPAAPDAASLPLRGPHLLPPSGGTAWLGGAAAADPGPRAEWRARAGPWRRSKGAARGGEAVRRAADGGSAAAERGNGSRWGGRAGTGGRQIRGGGVGERHAASW